MSRLLATFCLLLCCAHGQAIQCGKVFYDFEVTRHFVSVLDGKVELAIDNVPRKNSPGKVVYLDGLGLSFRHSQSFANRLRSQGVELVRIDMIGVGNSLLRSLRQSEGKLDLTEVDNVMQARAVIEVIEHISNQKVYLVGESYGGAVAATVAKLRPDLIERVSLVAPMIKDLIHTHPMTSSYASWSEGLAQFNWMWGATLRNARRQALERSFADLIPGPLQAYREQYLEAIYVLGEGVRYFDMGEMLSGVKVKVDMIFGEKDHVISRRFYEEAFSQVPPVKRGRLIELEEGKHDLIVQFPHFLGDWVVEGIR